MNNNNPNNNPNNGTGINDNNTNGTGINDNNTNGTGMNNNTPYVYDGTNYTPKTYEEVLEENGVHDTHKGECECLDNVREEMAEAITNTELVETTVVECRIQGVLPPVELVSKARENEEKLERLKTQQTELEGHLDAGGNCDNCENKCENNSEESWSPLDQFEIRDLISLDAPIFYNLHLSLTNIGLYLSLGAFVILTLALIATNRDKVIFNRWSLMLETIYATVLSIVINQINSNKGQIYFPFIYGLFLFILINNLIGMVPYSFASTSHFVLAFSMSFTVVLGATILGFNKHGLGFFSLLVPAGCPLGLLPILVLIEFISYLARNVSLGLRLSANILSGHMLLNILAGFCYNIMTSGFLFIFVGLIPLAFIIAFSGLELGIAFIQAQVFVVLTSGYIKDALDLH